MSDSSIQQKLEQLEQRLDAAEKSLAGRIKTSAEWIAEQITVNETEKTAHQVLIQINKKYLYLKIATPGTEDRVKNLTESLGRIDVALSELYKARNEMEGKQSAPADKPTATEPAPNGAREPIKGIE